MPDIAVKIQDSNQVGLDNVEFTVIGGIGMLAAVQVDAGVYVLEIADHQDLVAFVPDFYDAATTNVGDFPSNNPWSPTDYQAGQYQPLTITLQEVATKLIAVYVTDMNASPITEGVEFQVLDPPDAGDFKTVSSSSTDIDGVYTFAIDDNINLMTCVEGQFECDLRDIGDFPSTSHLTPGALESGHYPFELIMLEALDEPYTPEEEPVEEVKPPGYYTKGCFVATAANHTPLAPDVQFLREIRDEVLIGTRSGNQLFDTFHRTYYREFSPAIVEMMAEDREVMELVRWAFVKPLVNYLRLMSELPSASLADVPEPWRQLLADGIADYEAWVSSCIDIASAESGQRLWRDFSTLDGDEAGDEIDVLFTYLLRSGQARNEYLDSLERAGELPLTISAESRPRLTAKLEATGLSAEQIQRIIAC